MGQPEGPRYLSKAKEKEADPRTGLLVSLHWDLLRLDSNDFTSVVCSASLACSVGQTGSAALGASDYAGDGNLPVRVASLVASCLGNFTLGYSHL